MLGTLLRRLATRNSAALERNKSRGRFAIRICPFPHPKTKSAALSALKHCPRPFNYDAKRASALQSWEEAGPTYNTPFDNGEKPEKEIAAQLETLAGGQSGVVSRIDALYTYVLRQIRYVALEIGVGGFHWRTAVFFPLNTPISAIL
jgi:hypothetical protein